MTSARGLILALSVLALGLGGCADIVDHDYRQRYPIGIEQRTAILDVASLEEDYDRLVAFAGNFLKMGRVGKMFVSVNGGSADDAESIAIAQDIGATLRGLGLAAREIELRLVVAPAADRRAVLTYAFHVALPPECGNYTRDVSTNLDNSPTDNFGCSIQRNLGLMIANPSDLLKPQDSLEGRSGTRGSNVVNRYERGMPIGAPKEIAIQKPGGK